MKMTGDFMVSRMKIIITERQYLNLVEMDLNEEKKEYSSIPKKGCETYVPKLCDPYSYLKVVDGSVTKYYFKKQGTTNWIEAKNPSGITSIQSGVTFNTKPEIKSQLNTLLNKINIDSSPKPNKKINLSKDKLKKGLYTYDQMKKAVNEWTPEEDNTWQKELHNSDFEYYKADKKYNVYDPMDKVHNWRNKIINSLNSLGYSKDKKEDIEDKLLFLTGLINDKYEAEHQKRWKSYDKTWKY